MSKRERVSLSEFARQIGVVKSAVHKAIMSGRIKRDDEGLIDLEEAKEDWYKNVDPKKFQGDSVRHRDKINAALKSVPPEEIPRLLQKFEDGSMTLQDAYLVKEYYAAKRAKLLYEELEEALISVSETEKLWADISNEIKKKLVAMSTKVSDRIALLEEKDINTKRKVISKIIQDEVNEALTALSKTTSEAE